MESVIKKLDRKSRTSHARRTGWAGIAEYEKRALKGAFDINLKLQDLFMTLQGFKFDDHGELLDTHMTRLIFAKKVSSQKASSRTRPLG